MAIKPTSQESALQHALTGSVQRPRQIASLDGLRAISVTMVIAGHTLGRFGVTHHVPFVLSVLSNGSLAVQIFFVISGFLITTLLLRERSRTGTISLRAFYVRRAFRILPPLYTYILVVALLVHLGRVTASHADFVLAATLTKNYIHVRQEWVFEHFWSLCIEEQFYLLWPGVLVFCLMRWPHGLGTKRAATVALVAALVQPPMRVLYFLLFPAPHFYSMFHLASDAIMFGAIGALLQGTGRFERLYRAMTRVPWVLPLVLFSLLSALGMRYENYFLFPAGFTIQSLVVLMWLLWLTRNPDSVQGRVLNQPAIRWVGRLSYSMYLWQTLFTHEHNEAVFGGHRILYGFPGNWVGIVVVAAVSYYLIEQPSLRLRDVVMKRLHWHET